MAIGTVTFYPSSFQYAGFTKTAEPSITAETYTCSGAETTNAAYDLVDNRRDNVVTIDTNGESTAPVVDMDLSTSVVATISPTFCIIDNHNIDTCDGNVKLQYGAGAADRTLTAAYSGALNAQLTTETVTSNYVMNPTDGICLMVFPAVASAFWNLLFDNDGLNFDDDITMGEWACGVSCAPSYSAEIGSIYSYEYKGIDLRTTSGGRKYGFQRYGKQRAWKLTWEYLTATDKTNLEACFTATGGQQYPFWVDLGENTNPTLYYVRFVNNKLDFKHVTGTVYSLSIVLEEEV